MQVELHFLADRSVSRCQGLYQSEPPPPHGLSCRVSIKQTLPSCRTLSTLHQGTPNMKDWDLIKYDVHRLHKDRNTLRQIIAEINIIWPGFDAS